MKKYLIIFSIIILSIATHIHANEIENRFLYNIGDEIEYQIEKILPNEVSYIIKAHLIAVNDDEEIWEIFNSPTADKRVYHRTTGNWITSYKDGNEVARAIPYSGGLKFPLKKGDKWEQTWTFTAAGGLLTGQSQAEFKVKKDTIKINNKKYKTLKVEMKNPLWNSSKNRNWKKHIRWIDIKTGKTVQEYFKDIGFKMEFTSKIIE
jgi:hypothetical protein